MKKPDNGSTNTKINITINAIIIWIIGSFIFGLIICSFTIINNKNIKHINLIIYKIYSSLILLL